MYVLDTVCSVYAEYCYHYHHHHHHHPNHYQHVVFILNYKCSQLVNIFLLWFTRIWLLEFAFEPTSKPPNGIRKVISKAFTDILRGFSLSKDNEWMWGYSENQIMYSPYCYCFCPIFIFVNSVHTGIVTIKPRKCGKGGWTFSTSHGADFSLALELVKGSFATCGQIRFILPISLPKTS